MEQWQSDLQNVITTPEELEKVMPLAEEEMRGVYYASKLFRMRISRHLISLINNNDVNDPIKRQFIPSKEELYIDSTQFEDVNRDDTYSPVKGLVHKYPTKALLFLSNQCGSFCRFCFRRHFVGQVDEILSDDEIKNALQYIKETTSLDEIILSGGDPLTCTDELLDWVLNEIKSNSHIKIIRIHTRLPINSPSRITEKLVSILKKFQPLFFVVHVNHANEISEPTQKAFNLLVNNGILCFSQSALLKGVNDNEEALKNLWTTLLYNRVKPYYLFHTDPVVGLSHFRVPIPRGIEIMHNLYDRMSGLAYPLYCFNVPGGYGHILLGHDYLRRKKSGLYEIETYDGKCVEIEYPEDDNVKL
jgi:lysine 2,3-aminomutase